MFCILFLSLCAVSKDQQPPADGREGVSEIVHLVSTDWAGDPLDFSPNGSLILTDIDYNPIFQGVGRVGPGQFHLNPPGGGNFYLLAFIEIPGFGKVKVFADNGGEGYNLEDCEERPLNLCRELARSRARNVLNQAYEGEWGEAEPLSEAGDAVESLSPRTRKRLEKVEELFGRQSDSLSDIERLLRESMWLGEEVVIDQARAKIESSPRRDEFLFGANCFVVWKDLPGYKKYFSGLLNFGTVPFYLGGFEPKEGEINSRKVEACLAFLEEYGLTAKGHPLVWFFRATTPEWLDGRSFEGMKEHVHDRVFRDVSTYRDRIEIWDIINEAHDWANCYEYSHDQLVELTRVAADAAREADPGCTRIVNSCCVFGEYVAGGRGHESKEARQLVTPFQYADCLVRDGVGFEVTGLQLYYTRFDLFEHKRLLDRFGRFGKPIHITEVAVPSAMDGDEKSYFKDPNAVRNMGIWHRPWDEKAQADWVEGFYTICYAHPAVEAVTWWDFSDQPNHFFPHGGFLRESGEPKESYRRLRNLLMKWGFEYVKE